MSRWLSDLETTAEALRRGDVLLMSTDTVPGLHCSAENPRNVERLRAVKGRPADKPLLLLCADAEQAFAMAIDLTSVARDYVRQAWPGPFTFILHAGPGVSDAVTGGGATVAMRVPDMPELQRLIDAVGAPLVSTSANEADRPPILDLAEAAAEFGDRIDGVAGTWLERPAGRPDDGAMTSALVDLTCWPPRLLRPGPRDLP